jgi:hypothetical protein
MMMMMMMRAPLHFRVAEGVHPAMQVLARRHRRNGSSGIRVGGTDPLSMYFLALGARLQ